VSRVRIPTGSPKSKQHLMGAVLIFMNNMEDLSQIILLNN